METRRGKEPQGTLSIELSCPKCGAPFVVDDEEAACETCRLCGSLLILSHPGREGLCLADGVLESARAGLEICIEYRVQAERARVIARLSDPEGS